MKVIITIEDIENGKVRVHEERLPVGGETVESVTAAVALVEEMLIVIDSLGDLDKE